MSDRALKTHQPCSDCGSSDALSVYHDHTYCFSCGKTHFNQKEDFMEEATDYTFQYVPWRGISRSTMEFYDVLSKVDSSGEPVSVGFKWPNGRTQVRARADKRFTTVGEASSPELSLFGMDKFPRGGRAVTIHEGALDALSAFQMMDSKYPFVAVTSASSAKKECSLAYEYLNSFEKIYLCFDNDEPGHTATKAVAELFDFNKVYIVNLPTKDANELLEKKGDREFKSIWYASKRFMPEGILSSFSEIDKVIDEDVEKESVPYSFSKLQEMTYGIRLGEVVLLKAMEGIGKTEIFRSIEHHLLKDTDANVGIIHLEESKARSIKGLAGYELQAPCHLPDSPISNDEVKAAYRALVKRDDRLHIYSHFGSDDPDTILSTIRFMVAACECKYVFLDHITMVVTGLQGEDERKALDYISTRLKMMAKELDFALFVISHVNDDGQTRGSRNISKVADLVVSLHRDVLSDDPVVRNTTKLLVEKNRFGSKTGNGGNLVFDPMTFMITEASYVDDFGIPVEKGK